jgi:ABC-2 type transport system permease protein
MLARPNAEATRMSESMRKLWTVIAREYVTRVKTRWFIIATIFAPLVLGALIFLPIILSMRAGAPVTQIYNVTVIDATTTGLGERVAQILGGGKYANQPMPEVRVVPVAELVRAESTAVRDAGLQRSSGYLVIDSATVETGAAHYVGRRWDSQYDMLEVKTAIRDGIIGLRLERLGMTPQGIDSATIVDPVVRSESLHASNDKGVEAKTLFAIFLAFLMYMSIIMYSQSVLSSVVEEKTSRVAEVVISSVKPNILLAGKVIGVSAVGLTQQIVWLTISGLLLAFRGTLFPAAAAPGADAAPMLGAALAIPAGTLVTFLLFFLLGFVFFGSLYAALGATVNSESDARQAAQPVILLLVASVIFIQPVASNPESTLARVMSLLPFSSPILMPLRMAAGHLAAWEVIASLVILAASCVGMVWLSARVYRVGMLMYGKRPTLAELRHWISAP